MRRPRKPESPFRCFNSSPEVIRLIVMIYVRFPLSLRNVEDLLFERGIDICLETMRLWWNRFGPLFAGEPDARLPALAMAPGWDVREAERRNGIPLARGRPRRRGARELCHCIRDEAVALTFMEKRSSAMAALRL
jgi:hypothetical protein